MMGVADDAFGPRIIVIEHNETVHCYEKIKGCRNGVQKIKLRDS